MHIEPTKASQRKQIKRSYVRFVAFLFLVIPFPALAQNFWQQTNGPPGGDVRALIANDNDDLFAGTWGAGIYRSVDNGDSWVQVNDGLTNKYINAFAIHPNGMIFAGAYNAGGVFFSTDNGNSWNHTLSGISILGLGINPAGDIFAGTNGAVNNGVGLYRSSDHGQTWTPLTNGLPGFINVFCFAAQDSDEIYLGSNDGIYRSFDNGDSWTQIGLDSRSVYAIALHPNGDIFAGASNGVYLSSDNGATWIRILNTIVQSISINSVGYLFAGTTGGMYRSPDNGINWFLINNGLLFLHIWATTINSNDHLFAGAAGGILRSTDNGNSWREADNGIVNTTVYGLAPYSSDTVFAGTSGNGLFISENSGISWLRLDLPAWRIYSFERNSLGHIFVGTYGDGVFRSTDRGGSWVQINNSLPPGVIENPIYSILIKPTNNHIFLATARGGYRSIDNGDTWTYIGPDPPGKATALAINSQGHIYIGFDHTGFVTPPWGVHVSTDDGNTWTYLGLFYYQISSLAVNSQDHIFAGSFYSAVHRSTDNGNNWTLVSNGLNHPRVNTLMIDASDHLFAGTWFGRVYRSDDNGNSWYQLNSGMSSSTVFSLAINSDGYIFAGTLGGGVYRSVQIVTEIEEFGDHPLSDFFLAQNYPNPFNSKTLIRFFSPRKEKIIVEVFNILGTKVKTLYNGEVTPGEHQVTFEAGDLPSGVYIYRLKTSGISLTKKMILLQ